MGENASAAGPNVPVVDDDALEPTTWQPMLEFDRQRHHFVMGFECGDLWRQLKQPDAFEQTIHTENVEMLARMQEQMGRDGGLPQRELELVDLKIESVSPESVSRDEWVLVVAGEAEE
jgi:hypothetical protein